MGSYGSVQIWGYHIDTTKIYFTLIGSVISYHIFFRGYCSFRFSEVYVYIYIYTYNQLSKVIYISYIIYIYIYQCYIVISHCRPYISHPTKTIFQKTLDSTFPDYIPVMPRNQQRSAGEAKRSKISNICLDFSRQNLLESGAPKG